MGMRLADLAMGTGSRHNTDIDKQEDDQTGFNGKGTCLCFKMQGDHRQRVFTYTALTLLPYEARRAAMANVFTASPTHIRGVRNRQ